MADEKKKEPSLHGNSDYSPEVLKMLKGWKEPVYGNGVNKVLEAETEDEDDGRTHITWKELHDRFKYEKPAKGFKLRGDISQRDKNNWQYQKHVKLRDKDGTEHAVFFYVDEPSTYSYDDMEVGSILTIHSPRLHRFMDGQDGMRLDQERMVGKITKRPLTDTKRVDYATLMRENGNRKFKEEKYEDAIEYYETALRHVEGSSFVDEDPALKPVAREIEQKCHTNIASAAAQLKNYSGAIDACNKALAINPKSAKTLFRLGQCHAARGNDKEACRAYKKALEHCEDDPSMSAAAIKKELSKSSGESSAQKSALKSMYSGFLGGKSRFGVKKGVAALSKTLSPITSLYNFRDLTTGKFLNGKKLLKHVVYRSSLVSVGSSQDISLLCSEYGVKTILDMSSAVDRVLAGQPSKKYKKEFTPIKAWLEFDEVLETTTATAKPVAKLLEEDAVAIELDVLDSLYWESMTLVNKAVYYAYKGMYQAAKAEQARLVPILGEITHSGLLRKVFDEKSYEIVYAMRILANPWNHPVVLTCGQGKDMTAVLSILFLGCLGFSDDDIIDDFMESSDEIPAEARKQLVSHNVKTGLPPALGYVSVDTIREVLDFLDGRFDGPCGYLSWAGFTTEEQAKLRSLFMP